MAQRQPLCSDPTCDECLDSRPWARPTTLCAYLIDGRVPCPRAGRIVLSNGEWRCYQHAPRLALIRQIAERERRNRSLARGR